MRFSSWFPACTIVILLLLTLAPPALSELTKEDIEAIRTIVKEEITASEKRMKEHVDLRIQTVNAGIDGVNIRIDGIDTRIEDLDKQLGRIWSVIIALIGLIAATIAIPQIMVAYKDISANKRGPKDVKPENISA